MSKRASAASDDAPASKRQHTEDDPNQWDDNGLPAAADSQQIQQEMDDHLIKSLKLTDEEMEDVSLLLVIDNKPDFNKKLIAPLAAVMPDCCFGVRATPSFSGIHVETMDSSESAMILGSFSCRVLRRSDDDNENRFNVRMKAFLANLDSVPPECSVQIMKHYGSDYMLIKGLDSKGVFRFTGKVRLLELPEPMPICPKDLNYKFSLDIQASDFKNTLLRCQKFEAPYVRFRIQEPKGQDVSTSRCRYTNFVIEMIGDLSEGRFMHFSACEWNSSGGNTVRARTFGGYF